MRLRRRVALRAAPSLRASRQPRALHEPAARILPAAGAGRWKGGARGGKGRCKIFLDKIGNRLEQFYRLGFFFIIILT